MAAERYEPNHKGMSLAVDPLSGRWTADCACGWSSVKVAPNHYYTASDAHTAWERHVRDLSQQPWSFWNPR